MDKLETYDLRDIEHNVGKRQYDLSLFHQGKTLNSFEWKCQSVYSP